MNLIILLVIPSHILFNDLQPYKKYANEIEKELLSIESTEVKAGKLSAMALESIKNISIYFEYKKQIAANATNNLIESIFQNAQNDRKSYLASKLSDLQQNLENPLATGTKDSRNIQFLLKKETWDEAGFLVLKNISSSESLDFIRFLPIQTYQLQHDLKGEINVLNDYQKKEKRTRRHIGVLNSNYIGKFMNSNEERSVNEKGINESKNNHEQNFEPSLMFSYNVKAIGALANKIDRMQAKYQTIEEAVKPTPGQQECSTHSCHNLITRVKKLKQKIIDSELSTKNKTLIKFKSAAQLAVETATLESEAALANIAVLDFRVKHLLRMKTLKSKFQRQMELLQIKIDSDRNTKETEYEYEKLLDEYQLKEDANVDSTIMVINTAGQISAIKRKALR